MKSFFMADRRGGAIPGGKLVLTKEDPQNNPLWHLPGWHSKEDLTKHLQELFPEGLSPHGWQYLSWRKDFINIRSPPEPFWHHPTAVEIAWEFVRRSSFSHCWSRFQSCFAWETLNEAKAFNNGTFPIYRVEAETFLRADMRLLTFGVQAITASLYAHKYWKGEHTDQPSWEILLKPPVNVIERVN